MDEKSLKLENYILKKSINAITKQYGLNVYEVKDIIDSTSLNIKKNLYEMERNIR